MASIFFFIFDHSLISRSYILFYKASLVIKIVVLVADSAGTVGVVGRVPATGCANGDIMWLLDEPNQPYEGNYCYLFNTYAHTLTTHIKHPEETAVLLNSIDVYLCCKLVKFCKLKFLVARFRL